MYAGHFAAGMAIKAVVPRAPTAVLAASIFLPDLLWLGLSVTDIEVVTPGAWFDGWSHSFASIVLQSVVVGLVWSWSDARVAMALAGAVLSHLVLDLPMHPALLEWYPYASGGFGNLMHRSAGVAGPFGKSTGWWVEAAVVLCGAGVYVAASRRIGIRRAAAAAGALLILSLQVAFG